MDIIECLSLALDHINTHEHVLNEPSSLVESLYHTALVVSSSFIRLGLWRPFKHAGSSVNRNSSESDFPGSGTCSPIRAPVTGLRHQVL